MKLEKSVGAIVANKDGRYLLLKRPDDYWEFPKGHQKVGETDMETLRRELEEETGIKEFELVKGFVKTNEWISSSSGNNRSVLIYLIKVESSVITLSEEHNQYVWLTLSEAIAKLKNEAWKNMLAEADSHLSGQN
jgi:8-oxo-dGTP pyrophosphatase MutT (NUDIX family)